jgi:ParB family chromosome partitioning protein
MIDPTASTRRRGLGRGLELLIGPSSNGDDLLQLPIGSIRPNRRQPRRRFDAEAVAELTDSVRVQGVVQPVLVRVEPDGGYELIAGERRLRAARAAGLATIPALVREADDRDALLLALVENVAREDLSPVEEARAYAVLMDEFELSLGEVAERVGRSKSSVSNRLRLLELPDDVLALVERGQLSEGHARAVLAVPDHDQRRALARRIVRQGLSVRAAERAARWAGARTRSRRTPSEPLDPALVDRARTAVARVVGAQPKIARGRVEIAFADETELAEIAEAFERAAPAAIVSDQVA